MNIIHKVRDRYFDKDYKVTDIFRDILAGIIVGFISIPISMGYAQVAGIPMVYGLYGSLLPILAFALISTTRSFVFGVDAAPAALVGGTLVTLGISAESYGAGLVVPMMALITGIWLLFFFFIKAGRIVKYISTPVMGGFVTGICCTVILMQLPKLFGGSSGTGEAAHLIAHIYSERFLFHPLSFIMGLGTLIIILLVKKLSKKIPMPIVMMVLGVWLTKRYHVDEMGVKLLPHVDAGLPVPQLHGVSWQMASSLIFPSLVVAMVILAETLLASKGSAFKDGYSLDNNREVLGYAVGNIIAALFGCLPVNGSVSRTGLARQYGAKSQLMSVIASLTMALVLIFGTGYIEFMPVPILTAIVISALIGACEFDLFARLWKTSRVEAYIFMSAFFGVLMFGTIYGVVIGMLLSFILVIIRAVVPPRAFMGVIPDRAGFYDLARYKSARAVKNTVIYRFSGNLFFANIDTFQNDIEGAVSEETKQVIVNGAGITQIDVTAAERLVLLKRKLHKNGIAFYLTEHLGTINDQLRLYEAQELLYDGNVRRTIELALRACGMTGDYPLEGDTIGEPVEQYERAPAGEGEAKAVNVEIGEIMGESGNEHADTAVKKEAGQIEKASAKEAVKQSEAGSSSMGMEGHAQDDTELEWIFGDGTEEIKQQLMQEILRKIKELPAGSAIDVKTLIRIETETSWGRMGLLDEDDILERLEAELTRMKVEDEEKRRTLEYALEERKEQIASHLHEVNERNLHLVERRRDHYEAKLKENDPHAYELLIRMRTAHISKVEETNPKLAARLRKRYGIGDTSTYF